MTEGGMKSLITSVEQSKSGKRYRIYLDDAYAFTVDEEVLISHHLLKGEWLDTDGIKEVLDEEEIQQAVQQAVRAMANRPRSRKEVKEILARKGTSPERIEQALRICTERGYVDDLAFARQLAEHRIMVQKKGMQWTKQELADKGVRSELIDQVLDEWSGAAHDLKHAEAWVNKKWPTLKGDASQKTQKMCAFLSRKGFDMETIRRSLNLDEDF